MFVFYKPTKDGNWIKTISNYCKPLWNRCNEKGCIAWIEKKCKNKLIFFDYVIIEKKDINCWLYDIFGKFWDSEGEQFLDKQTFYFDGVKIIKKGPLVNKEDYKNWKFERKVEEISKRFDNTIKDYIKNYPEREIQTWPIKVAEAEKVLAGQTSEYLNKLAEAKGVDVNELAKKIKEKADAYADMYSKLEAEKDKKIEKLREQLK